MDVESPLPDAGCLALVASAARFSRAAAALGMSQPAGSQTIARLERAPAVRLFERNVGPFSGTLTTLVQPVQEIMPTPAARP